MRGKCGRRFGPTNLPLDVPIVLKSQTLTFLEPSGPVQAFTGIALTLYWMSMCWFYK